MDKNEWRNMRVWKKTQIKLEKLKAILTLQGKQEAGVSIMDRLVDAELERLTQPQGE